MSSPVAPRPVTLKERFERPGAGSQTRQQPQNTLYKTLLGKPQNKKSTLSIDDIMGSERIETHLKAGYKILTGKAKDTRVVFYVVPWDTEWQQFAIKNKFKAPHVLRQNKANSPFISKASLESYWQSNTACILTDKEETPLFVLLTPNPAGRLLDFINRRLGNTQSSAPPASTRDKGKAGFFQSHPDILDLKQFSEEDARIGNSDLPVLITGESGTGKESAARFFHHSSRRAHKPFVAFNCAGIPENLIESELFGVIRGAFTGADETRPGLVTTAEGGTLFLDEIGEMPAAMQVKILRLLQEKTYRPVGSGNEQKADIRVIAATNANVEDAVRSGKFRQDLYYRINGHRHKTEPLRERKKDILPLAEFFLKKQHEGSPGTIPILSEDAKLALRKHGWPGNARELKNTIERVSAIMFSLGCKYIQPEHLRLKEHSITTPKPQDPEKPTNKLLAMFTSVLEAQAREIAELKEASEKTSERTPGIDDDGVFDTSLPMAGTIPN